MIDVSNLSFQYPNAPKPALKNLTFHIKKGEIFGFLGPSGAGKSTTQKILIGLLPQYQGNVIVMDKPLPSWGYDYFEKIGVSFELPNHYLKLTARENLNYFRSLYKGETEDPGELLRMVGLSEDADKYVAEYSKGMKGRLNFARSLLHMPALLFLDEPTTGLDPINARQIKDLIAELRTQGTIVFLSTHNMMVAEELCDRVAFLVDGEINLIDSPLVLKMRFGKRNVRIEFGSEEKECREFSLSGLGENKDFLDILHRDDVQTIHTQETTLENIFIQVTGRELT